MLSIILLIVAGYVMFRYIEVLCKTLEGHYSKTGFAVLIVLSVILLAATGLLAGYAFLYPATRANWKF
jgi:hypothetical protein